MMVMVVMVGVAAAVQMTAAMMMVMVAMTMMMIIIVIAALQLERSPSLANPTLRFVSHDEIRAMPRVRSWTSVTTSALKRRAGTGGDGRDVNAASDETRGG
jgi:hypothetical protein